MRQDALRLLTDLTTRGWSRLRAGCTHNERLASRDRLRHELHGRERGAGKRHQRHRRRIQRPGPGSRRPSFSLRTTRSSSEPRPSTKRCSRRTASSRRRSGPSARARSSSVTALCRSPISSPPCSAASTPKPVGSRANAHRTPWRSLTPRIGPRPGSAILQEAVEKAGAATGHVPPRTGGRGGADRPGRHRARSADRRLRLRGRHVRRGRAPSHRHRVCGRRRDRRDGTPSAGRTSTRTSSTTSAPSSAMKIPRPGKRCGTRPTSTGDAMRRPSAWRSSGPRRPSARPPSASCGCRGSEGRCN